MWVERAVVVIVMPAFRMFVIVMAVFLWPWSCA